jgi:hypothetical protein
MKTDEYRVLCLAIQEGVATGLHKLCKRNGTKSPDDTDLAIVFDATLNEVLDWFHIERPWVRESDA